MAKKTIIQLVDDITGESLTNGAGSTVTFSIDGAEYEIDLAHERAEELRGALAPYVSAGRRVTGSRRSGRTAARSTSGETQAIREWALSTGRKVAARGRISADIVEAYRNR